jgi:heterodisulfide reductase subunit A
MHSVCGVAPVGGACSEQGWKEISELAEELKPNRILIGACMPYAYIPRLRELGRTIGLNPALMDVVDVYTPAFPDEERDRDTVTRDVLSRMGEALARLEGVDPLPPPVQVNVARRALIVGGGLAGMTAAVAIADQGYDVVLVEETDALGGNAMRLHYTLEGNDPAKHMQELIENVESNPRIRVLRQSRVVFSDGNAGRFRSAIAGEEGAFTLEHGVTILATGGQESRIYDYGFKVNPRVISQLELEEKLATGALDLSKVGSVAMIQCWRSRDEERDYCSRICCGEALKNILFLKNKRPDLPIYVFYRDIMSYGFREEYYTKAREAGAIFIRYDLEHRPEVEYQGDKPVVTGIDQVIGRKIKLEPDLLVLSTGIEPGETESLQEVFGIEVDRNGFFKEAESKWRPVDFMKQGVFMCGLARAPGNMGEAIASAQAAAARALRVLNMKTIPRERVVATVRDSLCSLCLRCVEACPYGARRVDLEHERIIVEEILCQGCGSCAAVCPNSATVLRGYHDGSMMAVIDAALEESL